MSKKLKISDIVGHTIEEILPYHDGSTIRLSNGIEIDAGITPEELQEPKHPAVIQKLQKLEDKLYDAQYGEKKDKAKQEEYKKEIRELMDSLVDKKFSFNSKPCTIKSIVNYKEQQVAIEQEGAPATKMVHLYSLED